MNIEIRPAAPADSAALATLLSQLGYPATAAELPARMMRLRAHGQSEVFVATAKGEVVGLVAVESSHLLHSAQPVAYVSALVVLDAARGSGIGQRLVAAAEDFARRAGCHRIVVTSAEHRAGAHQFYLHLGWEYTGRRFGRLLS